jgi:hypothetical protein
LKVNRVSSRNGGKGTNIMTNTSKTKTGTAPCPVGMGNLEVSNPKIFIASLHPKCDPKVISNLF